MDNVWRPMPSANSYRLSNPNVLATVSLLGSLQVFALTSMPDLRAKSLLLTGYLSSLVSTLPDVQIITPSDPESRGCQLSLLFTTGKMIPVLAHLESKGVVVDERKPNVIRVAPAPLYNSFADVFAFYGLVKEGLEKMGS